MVRSLLRRTLPLLVLSLLLAAPGISTAAPRAHSPAGDLLAWLRGTLLSLWSKNGCPLDPHGNCVTTTTPKNGCQVDPYGHCLNGLTTAPTTEAGCQVDSDGRCLN